MNKVAAFRKIAFAAVFAMWCPFARAQGALEDLGRVGGVDVSALIQQMTRVRAQDVFDGCAALDVEPGASWNVKQAALLVQTCLNHAYSADAVFARRSYSVKAEVARFIAVEGIKITVRGRILPGDEVLDDLEYSLDKRGGKLLGFSAEVDNQADRSR